MPSPLPASIDETAELLAGARYIADRALATVIFLSLRMRRPLFLEGEAGVGKTEIAKVLAQAPRPQAHPPAVLRGPRRRHRRLRMELLAPDDRDPAGRSRGRARPRAAGRRHLRLALPHPPAAAAGAGTERHRRARPADRRARPHRRGLRGLPARGAVGLPDHHPRTRHHQGRRAPHRHHHVEPHPRGPRRAQAPLPLSLGRLPDAARELAIVTARRPEARRRRCPRGRGLRAILRTMDLFKAPASPRRSTG
jgi:hypothetical protein